MAALNRRTRWLRRGTDRARRGEGLRGVGGQDGESAVVVEMSDHEPAKICGSISGSTAWGLDSVEVSRLEPEVDLGGGGPTETLMGPQVGVVEERSLDPSLEHGACRGLE